MSSDVDEKHSRVAESCRSTGSWTTTCLSISAAVNMMFTGFVLLKLSDRQTRVEAALDKLQTDVTEIQMFQLSEDKVMKQLQLDDVLSGCGEGRVKRSAPSPPSQTSGVAVNVGHVFVSLIKQMCKPEGSICIPGEPGRDGLPGLSGRDGPAGLPGPPGRDGRIGLPGMAGTNGVPGKHGEPGRKGLAGKQGPRGITGMKGEMGGRGEKGDKGERGERGMGGQQGIAGTQGEKGETGEKGEQGWTGYKGEKGGKGAIGLQGVKGERGISGSAGTQGQKGAAGARGLQGWQGLKGGKGGKGEIGLQGEKGMKGERGISGSAGARGQKGEVGAKGLRGWRGSKGEKGTKGEIGLRGEKGMEGESRVNWSNVHKLADLPSECLTQNHSVLTDTWRKSSEHYSKSKHHCDRSGNSHGFRPGWHSFSPTIGGAMPETCTSGNYCGTGGSGWLKGSHPTLTGGRVSRTVCFSYGGNCCNRPTNVEVINCGTHYIYNLPYTPICYLAYCARG